MERRAAAPAKTYAYRATGKSAEYLSSAENFFSLGAVEESKEELAKADRAMGPQDMGRIRYFQLMGDIAFAQNDIKAAKQLYTKSLYLKSAVKRAFQKAHSIRSSPEIRRLVDSSDQDK